MRLNEIADNPGARKGAHARRPRHRLGQGQDRRPRRQGPEVAHRRRHQGLRGRPDAALPPPPQARLPPPNQKVWQVVNLGSLQKAIDDKKLDADKPIDAAAMQAAGLFKNPSDGVRLLGKGEIKTKIEVKVAGASASAIAAVEKAGGKVELPPKPAAEAA